MDWHRNSTSYSYLDGSDEASCHNVSINPGNAEYYVYSKIDIALVSVFMPIVFVVGVIGNASVVYVFFRVSHMRTVTNYYLVSLAMADLLYLCSAVPYTWFQWSYSNVQIDYTALGLGVCKFVVSYSPDVCFIVSTSTVVVLTVERYIAICWPMKFKTMSTKPKAVTTIILSWTIAALYKSPNLYFTDMMEYCLNWSQYTNNTNEYPSRVKTCSHCVAEKHGLETCTMWRKSLTLDSLLILMVIPLLTVLYSFILLQLRRLSKKTTGSAASSMRMKKQVIRMLMVTILVYVICVTPFRVLNLLSIWDYRIPANIQWDIVNMARILQYTNSAVNPIIYNIMSEKYRQSFKQAFGFICMCCRRSSMQKKSLKTNTNSHHAKDGELKQPLSQTNTTLQTNV